MPSHLLTNPLQRLNKLERSRRYLVKNFHKLMKNYPDSYVAIVDGNVVISDPDLDALVAKIKDKYGTTEGALIDYVTSKRSDLMI